MHSVRPWRAAGVGRAAGAPPALPRPGWVEHDAVEIWHNLKRVVPESLSAAGVDPGEVAAIGLANQRETTVLWDRRTGAPLERAIVWQDTRTAPLVEELGRRPGE